MTGIRSDEDMLTDEVFKRVSRKLLKHFEDVEYCLDDAVISINQLRDKVKILEQENQDLKGQLKQWGTDASTSTLTEISKKNTETFRGLFLKSQRDKLFS